MDLFCDDVIILHPVIDFDGSNVALNFHVHWLVVFTARCYAERGSIAMVCRLSVCNVGEL